MGDKVIIADSDSDVEVVKPDKGTTIVEDKPTKKVVTEKITTTHVVEER